MRNNDFVLKKLHIDFYINGELTTILDDINVIFPVGKITGIVGKSGSGKSVLGQAMFGCLPNNSVVSGEILLAGRDLLKLDEAAWTNLYGKSLSVVPQLPLEAFSPMKKIGAHIRDALDGAAINQSSLFERIFTFNKQENNERKVLEGYGFTDAERILQSYPHELSGGMLQRVLCAIVSFIQPQWILADEPTKGLDEKNRDMVRDNLKSMQASSGCGMIVITHDMDFARKLCNNIYRLKDGKLYAEN